ncbi:MAG TPA: DNA-directed RNA polymerase subunit omega [Mariprofundaceae bacterium]|nr:DNA-directed RNA polymerase subunit omega [Mariprofundaceae bacterium]
MARVTIEDCIRHYPNRFEMVVLAARRARQLQNGMPSVLEEEGHKPTVQALKELGEGYVTWDNVYELDEQERQQAQAQAQAQAELAD